MKPNTLHTPSFALLVSDDPILYRYLLEGVSLVDDFSLIRLCRMDVSHLIRMNHPDLILWDSRNLSSHDLTLMEWVRGKIHGRPIIGLVEAGQDTAHQALLRKGINLFAEIDDPDMLSQINEYLERIAESVKLNDTHMHRVS